MPRSCFSLTNPPSLGTQSGLYSGLPFLVMSVLCLAVSSVAEAMINSGRFSVLSVRRLMNSIGQYVPALGLVVVAFAGCDTALAVTALALGFGCNAATFSGFQVIHKRRSRRTNANFH